MKAPKVNQAKKDGNNKGVEKKTKYTKKPQDKSKQSLLSKAKEIKVAIEGKSGEKKEFKKDFKKKDFKKKDFKKKDGEKKVFPKKDFKKKEDGEKKEYPKKDFKKKDGEKKEYPKKDFKKKDGEKKEYPKKDFKKKDGEKKEYPKKDFQKKDYKKKDYSKDKDGKKDAGDKRASKDTKYRKPFQTQVDKMKLIWNKIRDRKTPEPQRKKLIQDVLEQIQNHILDITLRHDASRIIQCIIQYGNDIQREFVLKQVMSKFFDISKAPYGHFTVLKAIAYCNDSNTMKKISQALKGHFVSLGSHIIGARVVESILQFYPILYTKHLKAEFYGKNFNIQMDGVPRTLQDLTTALPTKRLAILDHMKDLIEKFHKKGLFEFQYIHQLTYEYTYELIALYHEYCAGTSTEEPEKAKKVMTWIEEHVQLISDYITKLLTTKPGCKVICMIISFANAKDRKKIIKSMKGHYLESILHPQAYLGILRLLDVVDDTVNMQKTIFDEWKGLDKVTKYAANGEIQSISDPAWIQIMKSPVGHRLLLRLLTPSTENTVAMSSVHGLEPEDVTFFNTLHAINSKKSYEQRRLEHALYIKEVIVYLANEYVEELVRHRYGSRVLKAIVTSYYPPLLVERMIQVYTNQPLTALPGKEGMLDNVEDEEEAEAEEEEVEEEEEGEDNEEEEGDEEEGEEDGEGYEEDEDYQEQLQEYEEDQKINTKQKQQNKKESTTDAEEDADEAEDDVEDVAVAAVEAEAVEVLAIEEDPTAHTLLKSLLHFDAAYEQSEDALFPANAPTVTPSIKQRLVQYEEQITALKDSTYSANHVNESLVTLQQSIDTRYWCREAEQVQRVGLTLFNQLIANDYALLYQWLQSNRACFALHELVRIPTCYIQFKEVLMQLVTQAASGEAPVDIAKIAEAHEGGKVFWRLCQTYLTNPKKQKKVEGDAPKAKKAKKQVVEEPVEKEEEEEPVAPASKVIKKKAKKN